MADCIFVIETSSDRHHERFTPLPEGGNTTIAFTDEGVAFDKMRNTHFCARGNLNTYYRLTKYYSMENLQFVLKEKIKSFLDFRAHNELTPETEAEIIDQIVWNIVK